jgi:hypothetical protein
MLLSGLFYLSTTTPRAYGWFTVQIDAKIRRLLKSVYKLSRSRKGKTVLIKSLKMELSRDDKII